MDDGYPPIRIPGVQVDKDSSDSDPEAVAARKQRKKDAFERQRAEEQREEERKNQRRQREEQLADHGQIFHLLCTDSTMKEVIELMSSINCERPEEFEERLQVTSTLREKAKVDFDEGRLEEAVRHWLGAVHCLDFTPRQMAAQSLKDRQRVREGLLPLLSNLSLASRKLGDTRAAIVAADVGLEVVQQTPYESSKPLRVKLRLRRALARGERRNFDGARSDAQHVLDLSPGHEEATCIVRNCDIALKRERGPEERRWKGPLNTPLPQRKAVQKASNSYSKMALILVSVLVPVLLARYFWSFANAAAA